MVHPVVPNDERIVEADSDGSNSDESIFNSSEVKSQNVAASHSKASDNEESKNEESNNEESNDDVLISSHTSAGDESQREISIGKFYLIFV